MTHLAAELDYTGGGMTRLADRMEHDGLVARVPDLHDRRFVYAQLTDAGRARVRAVWPAHVAQLRRSLEDVLGPTDLRRLAELSRALRDSS